MTAININEITVPNLRNSIDIISDPAVGMFRLSTTIVAPYDILDFTKEYDISDMVNINNIKTKFHVEILSFLLKKYESDFDQIEHYLRTFMNDPYARAFQRTSYDVLQRTTIEQPARGSRGYIILEDIQELPLLLRQVFNGSDLRFSYLFRHYKVFRR